MEKQKRDNVTCDNVTTHYALGVVAPRPVFFLPTQNKQNVTLSRCHVVTFLKMNNGYRDSNNSIYKYKYLYILLFGHFFTPPHGGSKTKT